MAVANFAEGGPARQSLSQRLARCLDHEGSQCQCLGEGGRRMICVVPLTFRCLTLGQLESGPVRVRVQSGRPD